MNLLIYESDSWAFPPSHGGNVRGEKGVRIQGDSNDHNVENIQMTSDMGSRLAANLLKQLNERFATHEQKSCLALATLLDPHFKMVVFSNDTCAQTAVKNLISQCAAIIKASRPDRQPQTPAPQAQPTPGTSAVPAGSSAEPTSSSSNIVVVDLWKTLDRHSSAPQHTNSATADATVVLTHLNTGLLRR